MNFLQFASFVYYLWLHVNVVYKKYSVFPQKGLGQQNPLKENIWPKRTDSAALNSVLMEMECFCVCLVNLLLEKGKDEEAEENEILKVIDYPFVT